MKKLIITTSFIASTLVPLGLVISCASETDKVETDLLKNLKVDDKPEMIYPTVKDNNQVFYVPEKQYIDVPPVPVKPEIIEPPLIQVPRPINVIAPMNIPTKLEVQVPPTPEKKEVVVPPLAPKEKLDRSGHGQWTNDVIHTAIMRNGINKESSTIKRRQQVHVDIYETALFKYAVDMTAVMGKDNNGVAKPITHQKIEDIVKIFEKHVNYGPGAHMIEGMHTFHYVDKLTIEFFSSSPSIPGLSLGSTAGVEVSLHKNFGNTFTMASLLLHEYGHHETLVDARLFHDSREYKSTGIVKWIDTFATLRKHMQADPDLAKYTQYFNDRFDMMDMDGYHIQNAINTPIGTIQKDAYAFGGPKYVFSSPEFVTRALMLLMMSETKETLIQQIQYRGELAAFMDEFKESPISDKVKDKFINLFLNDVYPIDHFAEEGRNRVIDENYKAVVDGVIASRSVDSKQIDHVLVQMISRDNKWTTINVSKDQLRRQLGEFHFNTNWDDETPEISKQIYMYSIDTSKLSESDAEQVKNWLNMKSKITFYDADNNVMGTTGHL